MGVTAIAEAGYEVDDKLGSGLHIVLVAIVSVYQGHEAACAQRHLCAFVIAGGRSHPTRSIAINRQSCNVYQKSKDRQMISAIYLTIIALVTCVLYSIVCKRQIAIGGG